ncbi:hypothetical protein Ac42p125 [Acinetobacter phage Ac42]|uniref:hypothetical protein n=1 Tax=Acinetobacter phage Ac42 TaxID=762660 RepID=UPI0001EBCD54|nr:hypothetical protein Ac42p125 [Acinetobacter phage Ac42]ADI96363.1 hypothetical protein Ac42p125 [Acinetobacter phage Ac42]
MNWFKNLFKSKSKKIETSVIEELKQEPITFVKNPYNNGLNPYARLFECDGHFYVSRYENSIERLYKKDFHSLSEGKKAHGVDFKNARVLTREEWIEVFKNASSYTKVDILSYIGFEYFKESMYRLFDDLKKIQIAGVSKVNYNDTEFFYTDTDLIGKEINYRVGLEHSAWDTMDRMWLSNRDFYIDSFRRISIDSFDAWPVLELVSIEELVDFFMAGPNEIKVAKELSQERIDAYFEEQVKKLQLEIKTTLDGVYDHLTELNKCLSVLGLDEFKTFKSHEELKHLINSFTSSEYSGILQLNHQLKIQSLFSENNVAYVSQLIEENK